MGLYDSFWSGGDTYPGAGFNAKTGELMDACVTDADGDGYGDREPSYLL